METTTKYSTTNGAGMPDHETRPPWHDTLSASTLTPPDPHVWTDEAESDAPHPLDIQPKTGVQLGWIDQYAELMTKQTCSPIEFNRLIALAIAAAAIQRRAVLRMSFAEIYPNVYGVIVGDTTAYRKTTSLNKGRGLLQRAMLDNLLLPDDFTSEGLLKALASQSAGLVLRDEIARLFGSHNIKYQANLKQDITSLFDGTPVKRRLSNDEIEVKTPYLNILGATTPSRFYESATYTDWRDGFLARWLFVMPEKEPDFDAVTPLYTPEFDTEMGRLAMVLTNIDRQRETTFTLQRDAFTLWDGWQRQAAKDAYYFGDDVTAGIVGRYATYALKFAMILAAVNDSWGIITIDTMQTAMDLADSYKATAHKLLSQKANYGVSGAKLQKIFHAIKNKAGTEGITQREIGRLCHLKKGELTPCMEKLISIGAVISVERGKTERYIHAVESLPAKAW